MKAALPTSIFSIRRYSTRKFVALSLALLLLALAVACATPPTIDVITPSRSENSIKRGSELVNGLAACGFCHGATKAQGAPLSGGQEIEDKFGTVVASNITPSKQFGIGDWQVVDIMNAIRDSKGRGDTVMSPDIHQGYQWLSDSDTLAIVSYLQQLAPVDNEVDQRWITTLDLYTAGLFVSWPQSVGYVPSIDPKFEKAYGQYLTDHVARCFTCHNSEAGIFSGEEYLAGGKVMKQGDVEKSVPPLMVKEGALHAAWSKDEIFNYLKTGVTPQGEKVEQQLCPVQFYATAPERDLRAVASYLRSLQEQE